MGKKKDIVDKLDLEILHILSRNPRLSCREIAKQLEVSDRTVARRVSRMEREGIILGYQLVLNDYAKSLVFDTSDLSEIRFTVAEWSNFEEALRQMYSTAADVIFFYAGKGIGKSIIRSMGKSKFSIEDALSFSSKVCNIRGWGNVRFDKLKDNSIKADLRGLRINPSFFRGIIAGMLENMTGEEPESLLFTEEDGSLIIRPLEGLSLEG
ncbi:MAG: winged helix-turn-helix transcriptional regulator [Thermoproteota archaeon]|nr:winged helix-turn-helix transcriptional regulator [Candidatus Brockarchaeota archaeon]